MTVSVATTPSETHVSAGDVAKEVSLEERKLVGEELPKSKPYRVSEVESTAQQEFNVATVVSVKDVCVDARCITVEAECSRELVPLDAAFTSAGQAVDVRVGSAVERVAASSAPFPAEANDAVLYKMRGDIPAGSSKLAQFGVSVKAPLDLHVRKGSLLYDVQPGSEVAVGPFQAGMDLRPIMFLSRFPTVLLFASGAGIAAARSVIEAVDVGSLYLAMRQEVRLYYSAPSPAHLAYTDLFASWHDKCGVKVRPTVASAAGADAWNGAVGSLTELFDEDDLEYNPDTTGAVVCGTKDQNDVLVAMLTGQAGLSDRAVVRWDI